MKSREINGEIHVPHFCLGPKRNCLTLAVAAANADLATADSLALAREACVLRMASQNFHVAGDPGFFSMEKLWKINEDKGW